ncbi:hypothetical protein MHBO_003828 [Bonamia ostreae]|uniref:ATP synthase protein MI25 n=1 Tax=Bonamia ostreae TaxID=126728 RepID=A0ABV2ARM9_9EUKA
MFSNYSRRFSVKSIITKKESPTSKSPVNNKKSFKNNFKPIEKYEAPKEPYYKEILYSKERSRPPPKSFLDFLTRFSAEAFSFFMAGILLANTIALFSTINNHKREINIWKERLKKLKKDGDRVRELQVSERNQIRKILISKQTNLQNKNEILSKISQIYKNNDQILVEHNEDKRVDIYENERKVERIRKIEEKVFK